MEKSTLQDAEYKYSSYPAFEQSTGIDAELSKYRFLKSRNSARNRKTCGEENPPKSELGTGWAESALGGGPFLG